MHICNIKHLHNFKIWAQYWFIHNFSLWAGVRSYNLTTYTIEMILYSKIVSFSWLAIIWCIQQSLSDYIRYNMATPKLKIHSNHCILKKNQKLSSLCINKKLKNLSQDDTKLIKTLREKYIYSPSSLDYNLTHVNYPYNFHHNKGSSGPTRWSNYHREEIIAGRIRIHSYISLFPNNIFYH